MVCCSRQLVKLENCVGPTNDHKSNAIWVLFWRTTNAVSSHDLYVIRLSQPRRSPSRSEPDGWIHTSVVMMLVLNPSSLHLGPQRPGKSERCGCRPAMLDFHAGTRPSDRLALSRAVCCTAEEPRTTLPSFALHPPLTAELFQSRRSNDLQTQLFGSAC